MRGQTLGPLFPEETEIEFGKGVLPSQEIRQLIRTGCIRSPEAIGDNQIQPASIDLRLGREALHVQASFLPGQSCTLLTKATAPDLFVNKIDLTGSTPALLHPGYVYIIPLMESLALPPDVQGIANPKSTTGRLDILIRLITESGNEFERVPRNYSGQLYVEVITRTFPIRIRAGMTLNQLRFVRGTTAPTGDSTLRKLDDLVADDRNGNGAGQTAINRGWPITVDLEGNDPSAVIAYQARKQDVPIELDKINYYNVADFWTPIMRPSSGRLVLQPDGFYLLASKRPIRVRPDQAGEMVPYDPTMGEFRVHYAGFFDPGFGYGVQGEISGTKAVLEVRATHEMPVLLEDDQLVGRLNYYKMARIPDKLYGFAIGSSYQQQGLALSKQFRRESPPATQPVSTSGSTLVPSVT